MTREGGKGISWIQFGIVAEKQEMMEDAEFYFRHALAYVDQEESVQARYFTQVYSFYQRQKQTDEAIAALRKGIEWLPDYAPFHISLGDYYKRQDIPHRAREEYEQALILDPGNKSIINKIKSIQ